MKSAKSCRLIVSLLTILAVTVPALTVLAADKWEASSQGSLHKLTYSTSAGLPGSAAPFSVEFQCDPKSANDVYGTLGFDLTIRNTSRLKEFPFDDFEGPDAVAAPVLKATVTRNGNSPLTFTTTASGAVPSANQFCFSVSELSKKSRSIPRSILQALAAPGAESFQIMLSDPRKPGRKLEIDLPVAGKQGDFERLLSGLK